jgi:hypothetical protein
MSGPPKLAAKPMAIRKTGGSSKKADESATMHEPVPLVASTPIPSSLGGTNWTVLSTLGTPPGESQNSWRA